MDVPESLKEVWKDPVWSKVISWAVTLALAGIGGWFLGLWKKLWHVLFGKKKPNEPTIPGLADAPPTLPVTRGHQSPAQLVSAAKGSTVTQNIISYSSPPAIIGTDPRRVEGLSKVHLKFHELLRIACEGVGDIRSVSDDADSARIEYQHFLTRELDEYLQGLRNKVLAANRADELLKNPNWRSAVEPAERVAKYKVVQDAESELYKELDQGLADRFREPRGTSYEAGISSKRVEPPIDRQSAWIRGKLEEVYQVNLATFTATLMIRASIVNDSPYVSPTIRCFRCRLQVNGLDGGFLSGEVADTEPISGVIRSSENHTVFDRGPFVNLCQWNSSPLVKHNHREGWLKFQIDGFDPSFGSKLSLIAVDGADNEHLIGTCSQPWPQKDGVYFVEP